ncbi:sensor histidine kinase [Anaeroselena agilis]|uniref:histidine kinase n=1 Tax=Anaeroselena agilis TaxID=3063788 RepID=A0ABU3P1X8_9FIRM|nr:HAMP domain-containing sensor histidine kinase [Selenomonadales bacterium 4137-cl]
MFRKTLRRLTVINSLVFFLVLVWFGGSLYGFVAYQLFDEVDGAMRDRLEAFRVTGGRPAMVFSRPVAFDPRIFLFVRDAGGQVANFYPVDNIEAVRSVAAGARPGKPQMQKAGGHIYRSLSAPYLGGGGALARPEGAFAVKDVVAVAIVDSETAMLRRLLIIILAATAAGMLAAVVAGYFLAGRALVPVRSAWEKQQQFVADASHELRTPLAVVRTNAELLLRYPDRTIQEESVRITSVVRETNRMSRLVATLLTLARADTGQPELVTEEVRLCDLASAAAGQFRPLAAQKGVAIGVTAEDNVLLAADRERLQQLLVILLDNAVKYTPAGGSVSLTCRRQAGQAILTVADTGVGIPPEDVPRIFDRFFRGDRARSRGEGGAGLGLAIARWIVESHGGKIRAESVVGAGTKIIVTLPVK